MTRAGRRAAATLALQEHGLRKLHAVVDVYWAEAAAFIPQIEALAEDASFAGSQLAASVASKVYYHLESYTDAVRLALVAGPFFNVSTRDEYTDTIVSRCIDEYTTARQAGAAVGAYPPECSCPFIAIPARRALPLTTTGACSCAHACLPACVPACRCPAGGCCDAHV